MADEADITADRDEAEYALRVAASRKPVGPVPNGRCHYCDELVGDNQRFCDHECATAYERVQALRRIRGMKYV